MIIVLRLITLLFLFAISLYSWEILHEMVYETSIVTLQLLYGTILHNPLPIKHELEIDIYDKFSHFSVKYSSFITFFLV